MRERQITKVRNSTLRNWVLTLLALSVAGFVGWAAVICWMNLHHDAYMVFAAITLTLTALLFFVAGITSKAEEFFLALIAWW